MCCVDAVAGCLTALFIYRNQNRKRCSFFRSTKTYGVQVFVCVSSPLLVRSPSALIAVWFLTSGMGARREDFRRSPCRLR